MEQGLKDQFQFVLEIDQLKSVLRRNVLTDRSRRENSAEHSTPSCNGTAHSQILRQLGFIETDAPRLRPRVRHVIETALAAGALVRE